MKRKGNGAVGAYMTVEAALVMSVVIMVYVFLIDCMIFQYERCVEELEDGRKSVLAIETESSMYDVKAVHPMTLLRVQRAFIQNQKKEEEKVE